MALRRNEEIRNAIAGDLRLNRWPQGKLPSVRSLALTYSTSPVTVLEALKALREGGEVRSFPGRKGYYTSGFPVPSVEPEPPSIPQYLQIGAALRDEIVGGKYRGLEAFPSQKECRHRFRCSPITARAVFQYLREQGLIERRGRHFFIRGSGGQNRTSQVYLAGPRGTIDSFNSRFLTCIRTIEREIHTLQWGQLRFLFDVDALGTKAPPVHAVAAYIYIFSHDHHKWLDFLRRKTDVPVVFIDNQESADNPFPLHKRSYHIVPDNRHAGREIALHLAALGHRNVAVITTFRREIWFRLRLRGIEDIFPTADANHSRSMSLFATRPRLDAPKTSFEELHRMFTRARDIAGEARLVPEDIRDDFMGSFYYFLSTGQVARAMIPVFEQALSHRNITAWICANDWIASMAQAFLASKGVSVPREISVAGFDNSTTSHKLGITSYDLNFDQMGYRAVQCLVRPELVGADQQRRIRVAGQIIERGSTGPAMKN